MLIDIQDSAYKDLKKIDKSEAIKILQTIKKLEDYPLITNVKKLTNHYPPFRLRIGDYRVLFDIKEDKIIVSNIKHRKEAY
ncbi:MAG: type II toxin-antitoxin system RelE/ParE family toxin [Aliarcobacter sp.]|jgi:mRNA interferase RelE/StbE|nr:type II toxin-antitoxin system RelE/ParE family toxin [Aliarcobacter sp.]